MVSIDVYGGKIFGFLGRNGAGKTTTIQDVDPACCRPTGGNTASAARYSKLTQSPWRLGYVRQFRTARQADSAGNFFTFIAGLAAAGPKAGVTAWRRLTRLFDLHGNTARQAWSVVFHGMRQKSSACRCAAARSKVLFHWMNLLLASIRTSARLIKDVLRQLSARGIEYS